MVNSKGKTNSTLSDYMITQSKIVIPAWTTAKDGGSAAGKQELAPLAGIQAPWMDLSLPSMALDTHFPASMTSLCII